MMNTNCDSLLQWPGHGGWGDPQDLTLRFASSAATRALIGQASRLLNAPAPSTVATSVPTQGSSVEEQLYEALAAVKVYTAQVAMHMDRVWRDKLFRQLDSLLDVEEWHAGDVPIRQSSFATFLKVMFLFGSGKRPGLGLSAQGNLIGAWTQGEAQLTIECLPDDMVRYVISHHVEGRIESAAGQTSVTRLRTVLAPYDLAGWLSGK